MFWSKKNKITIGTCVTRIPRGIHFEHHHAGEMVCGSCGTTTHDVYEFELVERVMGIKKGRGELVRLAKCTVCDEVRPLNSRANKWLYDIKAISQGEYLSWEE